MNSVIAIVITCHPALSALTKLLDAITGQVDRVVIVDNGSGASVISYFDDRSQPHEQLLALPDNLGVATAQNRGIAWAREQGASFIVLFDQDSIPPDDMIQRLLTVAQEKINAGAKLASVGPKILDGLQSYSTASPSGGANLTTEDTILLVDSLMASGCLIPLATLDKVGDMQDELFIDFVDIEWGLRAKYHGFQSFQVETILLLHSLGDRPLRFMGRNIMVHVPLRHYYMFRNALWMYRQSWLPLSWKLSSAVRLVPKYVFYSLFAKPQYRHWKMMSLGLWHGLYGKMGSIDDTKNK